MNPSITRVCAVVAAGLGLAVTKAHAQLDEPPPLRNWELLCDDLSTDTAHFSDDWGIRRLRSDLFGVTVGVSGTVLYETCLLDGGYTANVGGRVGFQIGRIGSMQDIDVEGVEIDDDLMLQWGMPYGVGGNGGYAKIVRQAADGTLTLTPFADDDNIDSYYYGASDRYFRCQDTVDDCLVTLRVDLLGDAARFDWSLENQSADASALGLWFGQAFWGLGNQISQGMSYVLAPGMRPLNTDTRFASDVNNIVPTPSTLEPASQDFMPDYMNFGLTQSWAYGLQIINKPTTGANSAFSDQTQVDTLDIGAGGWGRTPSLLGAQTGNDRPMGPGFSDLWDDVLFIRPGGAADTGYIQRWNPVTVGAGTATAAERTRRIIAYYKSTTGLSDYAKPYTAVVDAPKTIAVSETDPNQFNPAVSRIRVYIDNTLGFTTNNERIPLNDVRIQLDLPQGMSDATDATGTKTSIVKTIPTVPPTTPSTDPWNYPSYKYVEFQVAVSPEVTGTQYYTVTIEPQPGTKKVLTGAINVASTPRLLIRGSSTQPQANLVTAPWTFSSSTWGAILGSDPNPLTQDIDYQAFTWDPQRQEYVLQTGPQRGRGTFLISKKDVGYKVLGGTPTTPSDLATGAPLISLKKGWNLIANPYNYPIQVGQIVGVSGTDSTDAKTFKELAQAGIISASLAYWDRTTQSYKFTTDFTSEMLPNVGYWVNLTTTQDLTLSYPAVFTPFIPSGTGGITNSAGWSLNLVARTSGGLDDQNIIGIAANTKQAKETQIIEPPIAPTAKAVTASFREGSTNLARSLKPKAEALSWTMEVTPRSNDTVTLTWPNISSLPSNLSVTMKDELTGRSYDLRKLKNYAYFGKARTTQKFTITATDAKLVSVVQNVTASANTARAAIAFQLSEQAMTSVRILQSGRQVVSLTKDKLAMTGTSTVLWTLKDSANRRVKAGVYTAEIVAKGTSGRTETKVVSFLVR